MAARHHCDCGDQEPARRRAGDANVAHACNHGGCGLSRIPEAVPQFHGNFLIDDTFLAAEGITDFEQYRADPSEPLARPFFVPDEPAPPPGVSVTVERWE